MEPAAAAAPAVVDVASRVGCLAHWKSGAQSYCPACTDRTWRRWPLDPSTRTQHAVDTDLARLVYGKDLSFAFGEWPLLEQFARSLLQAGSIGMTLPSPADQISPPGEK